LVRPANGTVTFTLDLGLLNQIMASSLNYDPTTQWTGLLTLFLFSTKFSVGTWSGPTLTADFLLDYSNRDTGRSGYERARGRMRRCPTTGLMESSESFVRDGWTHVMVSSLAWDLPEPPTRILGPIPPDPPE
jgi:hypothetical protein